MGLSWNCPTDVLTNRHWPIDHGAPTMQIIYKVLASQYDSLGYILLYTTRGKEWFQKLWSKQRSWDDAPLHALVQWFSNWERAPVGGREMVPGGPSFMTFLKINILCN